MYEVCLCSVLEDTVDHKWKTLFTRFKFMGRKGEPMCVMFGMVAYTAQDRGITEREPGITAFHNWSVNFTKTEINNEVGFHFSSQCTAYDT